MLIALVLAGCTSDWRAPVESRGAKAVSSKPSRGVIRTDHYRVQRGDTLHHQLQFEEYLAKRTASPSLTFRQHLRAIGGEIEE